jgi:hypothetical protein
MNTALFFNGVPEEVLTEILEAQTARAGGELFLQKGRTIKLFKDRLPTPNSPIRLYISTAKRLSNICYTAEIIKWEDKRVMLQHRQDEVLHHLKTFQPKERDKFLEREKAFNLKFTNLVTFSALPCRNGSRRGRVSRGLCRGNRLSAGRVCLPQTARCSGNQNFPVSHAEFSG